MGVFERLSKAKDMSAGTIVDKVLRKRKLYAWRRRDKVMVRCGNAKRHIHVRPGTTDAEVVWQCFVAHQYEIPIVLGADALHRTTAAASYARMVRSGTTPLIIDCGANVGASSLWFKMRYPEAKIVAIEPAPDNVEMLKRNCSAEHDIDILAAGVGAEDSSAFLQDNGGGAWGYQTSAVASDLVVKIVSIPGILESLPQDTYAPFILKIDIEGAEKELFEGPWDAFHSFPIIIFEAHDFYMPAKRTASPFFKFHSESGRDFMFGMENVFSMDMTRLGG